MPRRVAPLQLALAVRAELRERGRTRGRDAFWRGEARPLVPAEAEGWDEGEAFLPIARWLPRSLLGPRSAAWREGRSGGVDVLEDQQLLVGVDGGAPHRRGD